MTDTTHYSPSRSQRQGQKLAGSDTIMVSEPLFSEPFVMLPERVLLSTTLSRGAKLLYAELILYARRDGHCFPGQERLGQDLGADTTSLRTWLKELREAGLIDWEKSGFGRTNTYTLLPLNNASLQSGDNPRNDDSNPGIIPDHSGNNPRPFRGLSTTTHKQLHRYSYTDTTANAVVPDGTDSSGTIEKLDWVYEASQCNGDQRHNMGLLCQCVQFHFNDLPGNWRARVATLHRQYGVPAVIDAILAVYAQTGGTAAGDVLDFITKWLSGRARKMKEEQKGIGDGGKPQGDVGKPVYYLATGACVPDSDRNRALEAGEASFYQYHVAT